MNVTLQQLLALEAVTTQGSFQAGADVLNRTHPSVITSLKKLEDELGFSLFDRSGYRTVLTEQGRLFYERSKRVLDEVHSLEDYTDTIKKGDAAELNVVIGDVTPLASPLTILRGFDQQFPNARLNLFFANLSGPNERLLAGDVDFIIHHIDKADPRYEYRDFCKVPIVPVVARGFLKSPSINDLRYSDLKAYTQCIIRDTSSNNADKGYFIMPDSPRITVGDQYTKKEVIVQGMAWGHMPLFMIENELQSGQLISIKGKYIQGVTIEIVIARLRDTQRGELAENLWQKF